jgi:hypothetical protein
VPLQLFPSLRNQRPHPLHLSFTEAQFPLFLLAHNSGNPLLRLMTSHLVQCFKNPLLKLMMLPHDPNSSILLLRRN